MKTIDFCIPFIGVGLRYTEFLVLNLLRTAKHPERISIFLSVHSQDDLELVKKSPLNNIVKRVVMAHAYTVPMGDSNNGERFSIKGVISSANHCSAIQALFDQAEADVVIFSDHDMAFLTHGWDIKISEILETHDLCGVGYPRFKFPLDETGFPDLCKLSGCNYQYIPNLSFLGVTQQCIEKYFPQGISSFHHYLANGGLPFQIVNTVQMVDALHLPLGFIWWMDSGFEIPFVIQSNKLTYQTFIPLKYHVQNVFSLDELSKTESVLTFPDVFVDGGGEPFLAHFGRGTLKTQMPEVTSFDYFMAAVNGYLAKLNG